MSKELTTYEWLFIAEYLVDFDATAACRRAGYEGPYARAEGSKMIKKKMIVAELERCRAEIVEKTTLTVQDVITDIANVLRADPRELIEHWRGACRFCWGYAHRYHRTPNEYQTDETAVMARGGVFDPKGGVGFNPRRDPNQDCPECFGEGEPYERIKDTRELSPQAAALYVGVERTKHGTKLLTRSKDAAREAAARYLGMNKETLALVDGKELKDLSDDELLKIATS